ncbi:hypothetical protein OG558_13370 [Kribbella sp. NBC_01510]|uniref:hypothetical protein n=1 Tax=Kribbella sp. NBC_01510 TaxID=2903581 RepID=UPI00386EE022
MDDIGAELRRLAGADPLDPIDAPALLARAHRGRRRRRLLSAGGGVAGVAVVAIAASLLPNLNTADRQPAVTGTNALATKAVQPDFTPVPGIPRGEAGAAVKLTLAEATRLCTLRYPQNKRPLTPNFFWSTTHTVPYAQQQGERFALCTIPGGDQPSRALAAAAQRDPMPAEASAQLRNCSVMFWTDLRNWRVMASDTAPGRVTHLIAVSPSGREYVDCALVPKPDGTATPAGSGPGIYAVDAGGRLKFDDHFAQWYVGYSQGCTGCETKYYDGTGRTDSNIARIRIAPVGSRNVHDITLHDGWFALSWFDPDSHGTGKFKLTAYDKNGNVLKVVHS